MKTPANVTRAIKKYSEHTVVAAYVKNHFLGEGANTIANTTANLNTTRQADAAINAGRWIYENSKEYFGIHWPQQ